MKKKIIITLLLMLSIIGNTYAMAKPELSCKSAVLIDMESGKVLYDFNKDQELPQASITKLMTYYVFKDYMKNSQIDENAVNSMGNSKAWNLPDDGSISFIKEGERVTIGQLFNALLIVSGNDSAMMLQDIYKMSGRDMVNDMNIKAKELGFEKSRYVNVSGLTMGSEEKKLYNTTTAYETAILGKRIIEDYPEILGITSNKYYEYKNIKIPNTNNLLFDGDMSVDGLKTGHTGEAGYCVINTESVNKNNGEKPFRLISVVLGSTTKNIRFDDSKSLLKYGSENYSYEKLSRLVGSDNGQLKLASEYYVGGEIEGSVPDDAYILKEKNKKIQYDIIFNSKLPNKIKKGEKIGKIVVEEIDNSKSEFDLVAREDYKSVSFLKRVIMNIKHLLKL